MKNTSSNRTFMELKYGNCSVSWLCILSSNRTFMELKFAHPPTLCAAPRF